MSYTDADVRHAVEKVLRVPDRHRVFSESTIAATTFYRITRPLLARLHEYGLPRLGSGEDARYDELDLTNIALSLRLPTPRLLAMRWWPQALKVTAGEGRAVYRVGVHSRCDLADCAGCRVEASPVLTEAGARVDQSDDPRVDFFVEVELRGASVSIPRPIERVLGLLEPVEWHLLPEELSGDLAFVARTGLADCRLASLLLVNLAREVGIAARRSFGLLVTAPLSAFHYWTEFHIDGQWVAVDPLLVASLARWGFLDAAAWPPPRSALGALWRIHEFGHALVLHNGKPTRSVTLPTRRVR